MFLAALLALAATSTVLGVVIVQGLRKPTCRICLFRRTCPNREVEYDSTRKPCWSRENTIDSAEPRTGSNG